MQNDSQKHGKKTLKPPIKLTKSWLRRIFKSERKSIKPKERKKKEQQIISRLCRSSSFKGAKTISTFIGFGDEVNTWPLIKAAWRSDKKVYIPDTRQGNRKPRFVLFSPGDILRKTKQGPYELKTKKPSSALSKIDLILVPGLAFDETGTRLGFGGGFYDASLKKFTGAQSLGVFFSCQQAHRLPKENHDQSVDVILTENGFIKC